MASFLNNGGEDILCMDVIVGATTAGAQNPSAGGNLQSPPGGAMGLVKYTLRGINFNSATTDNAISLLFPTGAKNYVVDKIYITNASGTLTTATVGVFSAASAGGTTLAADQAITVTSGTANTALNTQALTLSPAATICFNFKQMFIRIGTPQGVAATADVTIELRLIA